PPSGAAEADLRSAIALANRAGYRLKVAVLGSSADLGAVPSLWGKPQDYADFLYAELTYSYRGNLLVAMPNGFGFARRGLADREERLLRTIPLEPGGDRFVESVQRAVVALARAAGHPIVAPRPAPASFPWETVAGGAVAFAAASGLPLARL